MRKAVFLLTPVVATAALLACQDDSTSPGAPAFAFDAGAFDAPAPPPPDSAVPDAGPLPVTVFVTSAGQPEANVTVYWHDATGAVLGTTKTGADGKAVSSGAIPAMVSALLGDRVGATQVLTWTGVGAGDLLRARDLETSATTIGSYAVTLGGGDGGTGLQYYAHTGPCTTSAVDPSTTMALNLSARCFRNPSSVLAMALDPTDPLFVSYSFKKGNAPLADGGSVPVTTGPWLAPTDLVVTANNPPLNSSPTTLLIEVADELGFTNMTAGGSPATFKVAAGFADAVQVGVQVQGGVSGSTLLVGKRAAPAASFTLDFNDALPTVTGATLDATNRERPSLTWTGAGSLASTDGGSISFTWVNPDESMHAWTFIVAPDATSVQAPILPPDVGAWLPLDSDAAPFFNPQGPQVVFAESDLLPGYAAFRSVVGVAIPSIITGDSLSGAVLPSNGTFRATRFVQPLL